MEVEIASNGSLLAVAWIDGGLAGDLGWISGTEGRRLNVAIYDQDLKLVHQNLCIGSDEPTNVRIASVGDTWFVGTSSGSASGKLRILQRDTLQVLSQRTIGNVMVGAFVPRPGAGPLMLYYDHAPNSALSAALLDHKGNELWHKQLLNPTYRAGPSGVFTGDGFLVSDRRATYYQDYDGVRVVRVELDGTIGAATIPGSYLTEYPTVTWSGDSGRLIWLDFGSPLRMFVATVDKQGYRVGAASAMPFDGAYFNKAYAIQKPDGLFLLLGGHSGLVQHAKELALMNIDATGTTTTPFELTHDPKLAGSYSMVALGTRAAVAWVESSSPPRLGLALVDP
jgi:hypothetical protein